MDDSTNRRKSFRLKDTMRMAVRKLSDIEVAKALQNFDEFRAKHCIKSHFLVQKEANRADLLLIRKREPEIANYLEFLEQQLIMLASLSTQGDDEVVLLMETSVNISSHGICYSALEPLEQGDKVELRMHLATSGHEIALLAEVVRVETDIDSDNGTDLLISLSYYHLHPDDQEAIIRHMAKLQQLQLQARREGSGKAS